MECTKMAAHQHAEWVVKSARQNCTCHHNDYIFRFHYYFIFVFVVVWLGLFVSHVEPQNNKNVIFPHLFRWLLRIRTSHGHLWEYFILFLFSFHAISVLCSVVRRKNISNFSEFPQHHTVLIHTKAHTERRIESVQTVPWYRWWWQNGGIYSNESRL